MRRRGFDPLRQVAEGGAERHGDPAGTQEARKRERSSHPGQAEDQAGNRLAPERRVSGHLK